MTVNMTVIQESAERLFPNQNLDQVLANLLLEYAQRNLVKYRVHARRLYSDQLQKPSFCCGEGSCTLHRPVASKRLVLSPKNSVFHAERSIAAQIKGYSKPYKPNMHQPITLEL